MRISCVNRALLGVWMACAPLGLLGCGKSNEFIPPKPPVVTVAKPLQREVTEYAEYTGNLVPINRADIYARVSGYLNSVNFNDSDDVKEGDLLFTIDQGPYIAARDKARAEVDSREAELRLATDKLKAVKKAYEQDAATELELWQAEANEQLAKAHVAGAKAALADAELDLGFTEVKAPFDGRISERQVDVGNLVGDGERTLLAKLVQYQPINVYFDIPERDLLQFLEAGSRVRDLDPSKRPDLKLKLADGRVIEEVGKPDYADPEVNPATGTLRIRGVFENAATNLYPGLFVRVMVPKETAERLLVPEVSLQRDLMGSYVMVVKDVDGKPTATRQNVALGVREGHLRAIVSGLQPGDEVVINGIQRARDGAVVTPEQGQITDDAPGAPPATPPDAPTASDPQADQKQAGDAKTGAAHDASDTKTTPASDE